MCWSSGRESWVGEMLLFFFFQAEDGIRDYKVTGVQTCALPISSAPIDIAFLGIGENAHIAFNDPPADFKTEKPYIIVNLDEACRQQQVGEAWFSDISQVPKQAISMSAQQILKSKEILAVVPDRRKARAVKACVEGEISPMA